MAPTPRRLRLLLRSTPEGIFYAGDNGASRRNFQHLKNIQVINVGVLLTLD